MAHATPAVPDNTATQRDALKLAAAPVKQSDGSPTASLPLDGVPSEGNVPLAACTHHNGDTDPWWAVDLGSTVMVSQVKLTGVTCCAAQQQAISLYLGANWTAATGNPLVASGIDTSAAPQTVSINAAGQYLWVARFGGTDLRLCLVEVFQGVSCCRWYSACVCRGWEEGPGQSMQDIGGEG